MKADVSIEPRTKLLRIMLWVNVLNMTFWALITGIRWYEGIDDAGSSFVSAVVGGLAAAVGLALAYTRHKRFSGVILVGSTIASTLFAGYYLDPVRAGLALFFLAVPITIAATMLSGQSAIWTFLVATAGMFVLFAMRRDLPIESTIPPAAFIIYLSALIIVATFVKERVERVHAAKLEESSKMASLGLMSAGIAHEINNPLFVLNVAAMRLEQMVHEGGLDKNQLLDLSAKISDMSRRIEQTVHGLKQFAREASADPLHDARVKDVIHSTRELCRHRFADEKIRFTIGEVPEDAIVTCRPVQISQVLVNLLNNAIDAVAGAEDKWVRIEVAMAGKQLEIAVTDSGPGVPESDRQKIMHPFFTTKSEGKGTGLGLSLSLSIARDHGGRLYLDTASRHTRFVLELPKKHARQGSHTA